MNIALAIYFIVIIATTVAAVAQIRVWPRGFGEWLFFTILTGITLFLVGFTVKFLL